MRPIVRTGLAALTAGLVLAAPMMAVAQTQGKTQAKGTGQPAAGTSKAAAAGAAAPRPSAAELAKRNEVLATVNADKVTRGDLLQLLSSIPLAPGNEQSAYDTGLELLINARLLVQYLNENRVTVEPSEIDKVIDEQRRLHGDEGGSLEKALADSGITLDQFRDQIRSTLQWKKYVDRAANDPALTAYMKANPDVFANTLVKASQIQINVDENASEADKQKAREKLLAIKKDVQAGKITFADAANKYSEDPTNQEQPSGGDLKYFPRKGKFPEAFSAAAFSTPKNGISDPVQTEFGMHIIQVTDRREGKMPTLEQVREKAKNFFAQDEQNRIVTEMRKKAKIDIKPMPKDLFGPRPAAGATSKPASGATPKS